MEICINIKEIKSFPDIHSVNTEFPVTLVQINNSRQKYFPEQISFIIHNVSLSLSFCKRPYLYSNSTSFVNLGGSCELEIEIEIFWRDRDSDTGDK